MNSMISHTPSLSVRSHGCRQTGTHHAETNSACEDVLLKIEQPDICVYGLADGQSGKSRCIEGAQSVLQLIANLIQTVGIGRLASYPHPDELPALFAHAIRQTLQTLADRESAAIDDFASTLLVLALDPKTGIYITLHLGDGIALKVREGRSIQILTAPDNGFLLSQTWLTSSRQLVSHLRFSAGTLEPGDRVILLTDGACHIACGENIRCQAVPVLRNGTQHEITDYLTAFPTRDDASIIILDISSARRA